MGRVKSGNLLLMIGGGIGYMIKAPEDTQEGQNYESRKVDIPMKLGLTYRYKDKINFEFGTHTSLTEIVKDKLQRTSYYFGIKIPIKKYN